MRLINEPTCLFQGTSFYLGEGLFEGDLLSSLCSSLGNKTALIADRQLEKTYAKPLAEILKADILWIEGGERAKTRETKQQLEDILLEKGYGKDSVLVGLGGGVVTDITGFLASTYLRGVPLVLLPTSLLAMVDAAFGGKNGVNTPSGKNLIGTFYPPKAIVADLQTLQTLPAVEMRHGMAEVFKMGLIAVPQIFQSLEDVEILVQLSAQAKMSIVEKDFEDKGLRRILNFGHTIGHALESVSDYLLPHGEAVAIGCVVESHLSMKLGYLSPHDFSNILDLYSFFPSLKLPETYDRDRFFKALSSDKKNRQDQVRFALIDQIGHALSFDGSYCKAVSKQDLMPTISWMEETYG